MIIREPVILEKNSMGVAYEPEFLAACRKRERLRVLEDAFLEEVEGFARTYLLAPPRMDAKRAISVFFRAVVEVELTHQAMMTMQVLGTENLEAAALRVIASIAATQAIKDWPSWVDTRPTVVAAASVSLVSAVIVSGMANSVKIAPS